eukprot:TRINITY_DN19638_c0_g1_i1.p1 TRINITY_DN19638_c0_g1~~TRINITY_DN19638_c0_g1_i1.p1  ORF type:complete len:591 (+),score=170.03 TRINITY_DN19638_c0_g1_i1:78-1850(+)
MSRHESVRGFCGLEEYVPANGHPPPRPASKSALKSAAAGSTPSDGDGPAGAPAEGVREAEKAARPLRPSVSYKDLLAQSPDEEEEESLVLEMLEKLQSKVDADGTEELDFMSLGEALMSFNRSMRTNETPATPPPPAAMRRVSAAEVETVTASSATAAFSAPAGRFEEEMLSLVSRSNSEAAHDARASIHSVSAMIQQERVSSAATRSDSTASRGDDAASLARPAATLHTRLPSFNPSSTLFQLASPQKTKQVVPEDGTGPQTVLDNCVACLDVIACAGGFPGVDSFRALCEHTTALKQRPSSLSHAALTEPSSDVAAAIDFVTDNNWLLWILKEFVAHVLGIKGISDETLCNALSINGLIHQLLQEVLAMAHFMQAHKKFLHLLSEADHAIHAQLEAVVEVVARLLCLPPAHVADEFQEEFGVVKRAVSVLVDVLLGVAQAKSIAMAPASRQLVDAYEAAINVAIDNIEKASNVLSNRFTAVMERQHALQIRAARAQAPFNAIPAVYDRMRSAYGGVAVPLELRCGSSADGVLLCLAARHVLKELHPQHHAAWRSADTTGAIIDFVLRNETDVRVLHMPPTFASLGLEP